MNTTAPPDTTGGAHLTPPTLTGNDTFMLTPNVAQQHSRSAIGTLVDRASRYVTLVHLPGNHHAETVRDAIMSTLDDFPAEVRRTLTWDQGSEMAFHHHIAEQFAEGVFFAHPGKPWQRGTNENT